MSVWSLKTEFVWCVVSSKYCVNMSVLFKSVLLLYVILLIMIIREAKARPGGEWAYGCLNGDSKKIEICQRCAKQTKSPIVYPMCCNEEEDVHNWCRRYTTYGKES